MRFLRGSIDDEIDGEDFEELILVWRMELEGVRKCGEENSLQNFY